MNEFYNYDAALPMNEAGVNRYTAKVFGWMFLGLMLTALTTLAIVVGMNVSAAFAGVIETISGVILIVFIGQVLLVGTLSVRVQKMQTRTAVALYVLYSIINGFTVGLIALAYAGTISVLVTAFGITAISFGVMAVYGLKTNADLTKVGNLLRMGLFGVLIMLIVNIFLRSSAFDFFICIIGLFVFLGLTAYDTKKIKTHYAQVALSGDTRMGNNLAIIGALMLYLDFVNIFLFVLRLLGGGRR
jgi:hypothetical protein